MSSSYDSKELFYLSSLASEGYPREAKLLLGTLCEFSDCFVEIRMPKGESIIQGVYPSISEESPE